jgi:hypothetical protein
VKTLSVLLSFALIFVATQLPSRLQHAGALPADRAAAARVSPVAPHGHAGAFAAAQTPVPKRKKA